ncbi:thioredoxin [Lachnospiraceae bacterium XBB2008]|nr:thioredoxin [Lachnospiraceae bacterium XBB2008]
MELQITSANFEEEVIKSELPVLVDFYADWCGPCKMMAPIVERVAEEYDGKLKVGKCNIDDEGDLAEKFGIMSIPTVIIFKNGKAAVTSVGALSQAGLEAKINEVL